MTAEDQSHGISWRALRTDDAEAVRALERLSTAGGVVPDAATSADLQDTMAAFAPNGALVGCATVRLQDNLKHERRAYISLAAQASLVGDDVGSRLLDWAGARAHALLEHRADDARPRLLRIDVYNPDDATAALFRRHGFALTVTEREMSRDLSARILDHALPVGLRLASWSKDTAPAFFAAYDDAFRERPGFPGWTRDVWQQAMTAGQDFRPDLSFVVLDADVPVAFAIAAVEHPAAGWIPQIGVRPAWRQRGVARALLSEMMLRFQDAGLRAAALHVNVNNPRASALYQSLGFRVVRTYYGFRKTID